MIEQLKAVFEAARAKAKAEPTQENREAAKRAWAELEAASPRQKRNSYSSRAGQRQHKVMMEEIAKNRRRAADRRWK